MSESFGRNLGAIKNDMVRSMGALLGIAQGLLCDGQLNDKEILFLHEWLLSNQAIANSPPANIIFERVKGVLADGAITQEERSYLADTLQQFVGGNATSLSEQQHVTELAFDKVDTVVYQGSIFCLTGEFAYAERGTCENLISTRGGTIGNVTKKLNYLIVGERGSAEWKHGSFGTKIEKALELKQRGMPLKIVTESFWATTLSDAQ